MHSLSLPLMQVALRESPAHPDRLLNAMALFGGINLVAVVLMLPYHGFGWSGQPFDPGSQLREDNLPFLLPFLLGWVWRRNDGRWCHGAMVGIVAVVLGYVALSEGRAALLGLIVGLMVFYWLVLGWRLRWSVLLATLVLGIGVLANTAPFQKANWTRTVRWMPSPAGAPSCGDRRCNILRSEPGWASGSVMDFMPARC